VWDVVGCCGLLFPRVPCPVVCEVRVCEAWVLCSCAESVVLCAVVYRVGCTLVPVPVLRVRGLLLTFRRIDAALGSKRSESAHVGYKRLPHSCCGNT